MNLRPPSSLLQITATVLETKDGWRIGRSGVQASEKGRKGGDKALVASNGPGWKARISTYEQQISIGIPFIMHHIEANSEGLHQVGCVASVSWQACLTEKSMLHFKFIKAAYYLSIWISKGANMGPLVC